MTDASPRTTPRAGAQEPPVLRGTYEDAVALRRWSFRQRTPAQRLEWLVSMLRIAYQTGALKPREPGSPPRHKG
jgi:hypothetical protein